MHCSGSGILSLICFVLFFTFLSFSFLVSFFLQDEHGNKSHDCYILSIPSTELIHDQHDTAVYVGDLHRLVARRLGAIYCLLAVRNEQQDAWMQCTSKSGKNTHMLRYSAHYARSNVCKPNVRMLVAFVCVVYFFMLYVWRTIFLLKLLVILSVYVSCRTCYTIQMFNWKALCDWNGDKSEYFTW